MFREIDFSITLGEAEVSNPSLERFKSQIGQADGRFIQLRTDNPLAVPLWITARSHVYPFEGLRGISPRSCTERDKVLLLSVHTKQDIVSDPVGYIDWRIDEQLASVATALHLSYPEVYDAADYSDIWLSNAIVGFKVAIPYKRRGVGSLLIASSAIALQNCGVEAIQTSNGKTDTTEQAQGAWGKFGIRDGECTLIGREVPIPLERILNHPQTDSNLLRFVV